MAPRILIVEDDRNMRELLALHLRNAGYQVEAAADGILAGYKVLERRPDLIITDIRMPHLDGFAFVAALRAEPTLRDIPVVFISGAVDQETRIRELGGVYLRKPIRADELMSAVARCLGRNAVSAS